MNPPRIVFLCSPNFVRDRSYCFTWSPNHEEHHQSLMLRVWELNPKPSDWHTCMLTTRPRRLSRVLPLTAVHGIILSPVGGMRLSSRPWNQVRSADWPQSSPWMTWIEPDFKITQPWIDTKCFHAWLDRRGRLQDSPNAFDADGRFLARSTFEAN